MSSKKPKIPAAPAPPPPTPRPFDEAALEIFSRDLAKRQKKKRGYQSTVMTGGRYMNDKLGA